MRWTTSSVVALALWAASAHAQPQVLAGLRAGVTLPTTFDLPAGPVGGVDLAVRMARLVAAELTLEQSAHWVEVIRGETAPAHLTVWTLGIQYRLDVARVIPYATLSVEGRRLAVPRRGTELGYGASFAAGAFVPFGKRWFLGAEARYGIGNDGAFPTRQTYLLRFGWRSGAF